MDDLTDLTDYKELTVRSPEDADKPFYDRAKAQKAAELDLEKTAFNERKDRLKKRSEEVNAAFLRSHNEDVSTARSAAFMAKEAKEKQEAQNRLEDNLLREEANKTPIH